MILNHVYFRNITESQIDDIFSKYGNIVQKNILKDKLTGLPRGVAFVRYVFSILITFSFLKSYLAKICCKGTVLLTSRSKLSC